MEYLKILGLGLGLISKFEEVQYMMIMLCQWIDPSGVCCFVVQAAHFDS